MWSKEVFVGGHSALDFLNTVGDEGKSRGENRLVLPSDLVSWIRAAGLDHKIVTVRPPTQTDVENVVRFREAAYLALWNVCEGVTGASPDLAALESYLKAALLRAEIDLAGAPAIWNAPAADENYFTDSFALLVDDLLRSPEISRLRQCERCTWLFLNSGRGRGRRWCNMATCGNRHKVEAHRLRLKKSAN